ncbi:isopentenyl-diphosphate Delta-isomerase [Janibacter sp. LM]|uniref:isopentenyl-diphosphate Delta-isomerase n=1 Tax=Janibacter sp. LM TaxID=3144845 RepID=UPI0031F685EC
MTHDTGSPSPAPPDEVVLLDDDGTPTGTAPRASVHSESTPLHLAFSCYLHDDSGRVLLTRRALVKRTWPGVWTNSFCGHPRPDEALEDAVRRHAEHELGLRIHDVHPLLPHFRYRAVDASGTVENEVCPVFTARTRERPRPNADEVMDLRWVAPGELAAAARAAPWALSPWMLEQLATAADRRIDTLGHVSDLYASTP